ncbi:MAG: hypothetical protein WB780_03685 [Candidatus Acidiferrales bacterium]
MKKKVQEDSAHALSPALKDFIDSCLVPILVKEYLEQASKPSLESHPSERIK